MRTLRARPVLVGRLLTALVLAGPLAACTASHPAPDSRSTGPSAAAQLAIRVAASLAAMRSVHLEFTSTGSAAGTTSGQADVRPGTGSSGANRLSETLPTGDQLEVVTVGGVTYAKLPVSLYRSRRPWVRLSRSSSSPVIRTLATTMGSGSPAASLDTLAPLIRAASVVRTATVPGGGATRYTLTVATSRLPGNFPGRGTLESADIATLTVTVDLDPRGRPVRLSESAQTVTISTTTTIVLSRFDQPVTISPPPADQVGTD